MPHMDLPPCLSTDETREGRERRQGNRKPCPGPDGALSPASPPGFVTALTTARSRDAPAECFDERLPRRLPLRGSPGAFVSLYPQAAKIPPSLLVVYVISTFSRTYLPILSGTTPLILTAERRKINSWALQEVHAYYAR